MTSSWIAPSQLDTTTSSPRNSHFDRLKHIPLSQLNVTPLDEFYESQTNR
ncbi:MAG: hypothetical protein IJ196_07395 [Prevotella sp.]|nr:hypothetical protein [Prevotella sp.]